MKKILSIDGGGIRGIIPALVLAEMERRMGAPIAHLFDLLVGTSTGGILSLALTKPLEGGKPQFSSEQLALFYEEKGRDIFQRSFWKGMSSVYGLSDEKYSREGIDRVLKDVFGETPLGVALTPVVVSAYDIERREAVFIKSWKPESKGMKMVDAACATSASPTYFEPVKVEMGGQQRALVDGGIFINSPAVSAYIEALKLYPGEDLLLVSLGTGELTRPIPYEEAKHWGKIEWLQPLLSCMFDGVASASHYQMNMLLPDRYFRLQTRLEFASDDMDNASRGNIENLKQEARRLIAYQEPTLHAVCEALTTGKIIPLLPYEMVAG